MKNYIKILLVFLSIALFIIACGDSNNKSFSSSSNGNSKKTQRDPGEKIYRISCVTCHGINGDMQANGAKNFKESTLSLEERIHVITNGRKLMTPFKGILSEKKIEQVAKYTMKFSAPKEEQK